MRPSARKTKCSIANVWKLGFANRPGSLGSNSSPHHRAQEVPQERTYHSLSDLSTGPNTNEWVVISPNLFPDSSRPT